MYCPSCGSENTTGLKYCNRCGANLGVLTNQSQIVQVNLTKPTLIIGIVLAIVTLGGFGALLGAAMALSTVSRGDDFLAVPVFGMMFICLIDILLIRQLSKIINAALKSPAPPEPIGSTSVPQALPQPSRLATAQLAGAPSVTEHTTRFFDPVYREPTPSTRNDSEK